MNEAQLVLQTFDTYAQTVTPIIQKWDRDAQTIHAIQEDPAERIVQLLRRILVKPHENLFVVDIIEKVRSTGTAQEHVDFAAFERLWEDYRYRLLTFHGDHFRTECGRMGAHYTTSWFACVTLGGAFTLPTYQRMREIGNIGDYSLWVRIVKLLNRPVAFISTTDTATQSVQQHKRMTTVKFIQAMSLIQQFLNRRKQAMTAVLECQPFLVHVTMVLKPAVAIICKKLTQIHIDLINAPLDVLSDINHIIPCQATLQQILQALQTLCRESESTAELLQILTQAKSHNQKDRAQEDLAWIGQAGEQSLHRYGRLFSKAVKGTYLRNWSAALIHVYQSCSITGTSLRHFKACPLATGQFLEAKIQDLLNNLVSEVGLLDVSEALTRCVDQDGDWTYETLSAAREHSAVLRDVSGFYNHILDTLTTDLPSQHSTALNRIQRQLQEYLTAPFPNRFAVSAALLQNQRDTCLKQLASDEIPALRQTWEETLLDFLDFLKTDVIVDVEKYEGFLQNFATIVSNRIEWPDETMLSAVVPIDILGMRATTWFTTITQTSHKVIEVHQKAIRDGYLQQLRALVDVKRITKCDTQEAIAPFSIVWSGIFAAHILLEGYFV